MVGCRVVENQCASRHVDKLSILSSAERCDPHKPKAVSATEKSTLVSPVTQPL